MDEREALEKAVDAGQESGCLKSQRGVVIWRPNGGIVSSGWNAPASGKCDGSDACRRDCNKLCNHAEQAALFSAHRWGKSVLGAEMLHVKVVDGKPVTSGYPSCWQCSRAILAANLSGMWLLHTNKEGEPELIRYDPAEFHRLTLEHCGIHPYSKTVIPVDPAG